MDGVIASGPTRKYQQLASLLAKFDFANVDCCLLPTASLEDRCPSKYLSKPH